jgi:leader peptidase (prepilin peptidase)/N-methyltransferase
MVPAVAARALAVVGSGLLGLIVGSFLNVVIYRVPRGMSVVAPRSHCPTCGTTLSELDNVPVLSWILLRARCRYCRAPIPVRYPLVELATGCSFVAVTWAAGNLTAVPSLLMVVAAVVAAAGIDADGLAVPLPVALVAGAGAASLVIVTAAEGDPARVGWAAVGAVLGGGVSLLGSRSGTGARRAPIAGAVGWSAGWLWPVGGLVLGAAVVVLALSGRRSDRGPVGRAPLVTLGALGVVLLVVGEVVGGPR